MDFSATALTVLLVVTVCSFLLTVPLALGEGAVSRLTLARAEDLEQDGAKAAAKLWELAENRREVLFYLRSFRAFVTVAAVASVALAASRLGWRWWLVFAAVLVLGWILLVVVTLPWNRLGQRYPEGVLRALAGFLYWIWSGARPFAGMMKAARGPSSQTEQEARDEAAEELREMVDQLGEPDSIEEADREIIRSVFEMGRTLVREVMVPRVDMVSIGAAQSLDEALTLFVRSGYSRVPVVGDDADDVRGVLYLKDVLRRVHEDPSPDSAARQMLAEQAMREVRFIPEMKLVDDTLRDMQENRYHMAVLVDEYGLVAGLVTLEDLVEEVIGEVSDEHDHAEAEPEALPDGTWLVPARLPLVDLNDLLDLEIADEDIDTVGGLLTKALGHVPLVDEAAQVEGLELRAVAAEGRRRQISKVSVRMVSEVLGDEESE